MTKPNARSEKTRLELLLERKDRHLKNVAKIETILARQNAFLGFGSKAKARVRYRDLWFRANAPAADLALLGLTPATDDEKKTLAPLLGLFAAYPWAEKDHAPTEPKA